MVGVFVDRRRKKSTLREKHAADFFFPAEPAGKWNELWKTRFCEVRGWAVCWFSSAGERPFSRLESIFRNAQKYFWCEQNVRLISKMEKKRVDVMVGPGETELVCSIITKKRISYTQICLRRRMNRILNRPSVHAHGLDCSHRSTTNCYKVLAVRSRSR